MITLISLIALLSPLPHAEQCEITANLDTALTFYAPQDEAHKSQVNFYVSFEEAVKEQKKGALIIDTRQREVTDIDSAIQLPLHAIKTKSFLKNKQLYLVHEALSRESIENQVTDLMLTGFKQVSIVELPPSSDGMNFIQPEQVMINSDYANWFIVSLDGLLPKGLRGLNVNLYNKKSMRQFVTLASHYQEQYPLGKVIITAADTSLYNRLNQQLPSDFTETLWFVEGGVQAQYKYAKNSDSIIYGKPSSIQECIWR